MTRADALPGDGRLQWTAGGWFGAVFGLTGYLLAGAVLFFRDHSSLAALWAACWCASVVGGVWLWSRRGRIRPYPALKRLLLITGASAVAALVGLTMVAPEDFTRWSTSPRWAWLYLLVFPWLMILFSFIEKEPRAQD